MQYMVIMRNHSAFMTDYYNNENCWDDDVLCVVDTINDAVTFDGKTWMQPENDHL